MGHKLTFRDAERKDTALILQFIKELANYVKMLDEVVADEATLEMWIFDKQKAEVIFALEDGKAILKKLAQIAVERGCGRLEWWCLDWKALQYHPL